jgi:hypothetical protein
MSAPNSPTDAAVATDRDTVLRQLAHDLRNHLYVIGLSAAVLKKRGPTLAEFDQLVTAIANEHKQAVAVLDEVLRVARGE